MIKHAIKGDEYRDITPYWAKRLMEYNPTFEAELPFNKWIDMLWENEPELFTLNLQQAVWKKKIRFKDFNKVVFTLGYPKKTKTDLIITKKYHFTCFSEVIPDWAPADTPKDKLFFCIIFT